MSLFDELDELASAYLDGETTPEETARVEADPAVMNRVEELRQIAEAVAAPVTPPPDAARESAIAAALAAFDLNLTDEHAAVEETASRVQPDDQAKTEHRPSGGAAFRPAGASRSTTRTSTWERFTKMAPLVAAAFVGIFAIGFVINSINSDDAVDTAASVVADAASDTVTESADAAEDAMEDDAMEDDAMEEEITGDSAALDDAAGATMAMEAPTEATEEAAMEEDAMEDDAMEEDAMSDDAMSDDAMEDDAMAEAAPAADAESQFSNRAMDFELDLGTFDNPEALAAQIAELDVTTLVGVETELAECADLLVELSSLGVTNVVGTASVNQLDNGEAPPPGQLFTVLRQDRDGAVFSIMIELDSCTVVSEIIAAG